MSDWQPIETAPKDGSGLWGFIPDTLCQQRVIWWGKVSHVPIYGWCCGDDVEDVDLCRPTHWTPLPDPPARTGRREALGEVVRALDHWRSYEADLGTEEATGVAMALDHLRTLLDREPTP